MNNMSIDYNCEILLNLGLLWQHGKCAETPFLSYSCISYSGHACLNLVLISLLTGKCATQN